ncbi:MAG: AAA family ATPase [Hyphomicrobium sp.]
MLIKDANEALAQGFDILQGTDEAWCKNKRPSSSWREHSLSARQLQLRAYPPINYIVPGLIPEGLSLLVGRPKIGKSWLALDIALSIAGARICLGDREPDAGDVLYCALEDNERRLKNRISKLLAGSKAHWPEHLTLSTNWRRLNAGGVNDIKEWAESVAKPRLVLLDTLANVKPVNTQDGYAADYAALTSVHRLANDLGIAIVALHHQRKVDADDPLDTVSGTLGIVGCADTSLILSSSKSGKSLYVRGRDIEEAEHAVEFDATNCRWRILGSAEDVRRSETRRKILAALAEHHDGMGPREIAEATGLQESVVKVRLGDMVRDTEVIKRGRGHYHHPNYHPNAE